MTRRIAASLALAAFAVCILLGMQAGNAFTTIVSTALSALVVTFFVGLVIGAMAQRMLDENLAARSPAANPANPEAESDGGGR